MMANPGRATHVARDGSGCLWATQQLPTDGQTSHALAALRPSRRYRGVGRGHENFVGSLSQSCRDMDRPHHIRGNGGCLGIEHG